MDSATRVSSEQSQVRQWTDILCVEYMGLRPVDRQVANRPRKEGTHCHTFGKGVQATILLSDPQKGI